MADAAYRQWLQSFLADRDIHCAVSISDVELSVWAQLPTTPEWDLLVRLTSDSHRLVEDKYAMSLAFSDHGIHVPHTWLGGSVGRAIKEAPEGTDFVVKGRFGSHSRGLRSTDAAGLKDAVVETTGYVTDRQGRPAGAQRDIDPRELVIIQERIIGQEYGLDVVCDLDRTYAGVLVRRKLAMCAGETDRAESVAPDEFITDARRIAQAVSHAGAVEVDVIVDAGGTPHVIDVSPSLGGGYLFSHVAGARIPAAYVAWATGRPTEVEWLVSEAGVIAGKYVEAVRIT